MMRAAIARRSNPIRLVFPLPLQNAVAKGQASFFNIGVEQRIFSFAPLRIDPGSAAGS